MDCQYLLVVAIKEGRHFGFNWNESSLICLEARFNNEVLSSDPIPLARPNPEISTELCWEFDRKCLHNFRIERQPIKLQCFVLDGSDERQFIGYIVLDIKSAQEGEDARFEWKPLLSSKYKGPSSERPELNVSLRLLKLDEPIADSEMSLNTTDEQLDGDCQDVLENDIRVKELNDSYHIWDANRHSEKDCIKKYCLSVIIVCASNLFKLVKLYAGRYHFKLNFCGKKISTESFCELRNSDGIPVEKIVYSISTPDAKTLTDYFELDQNLQLEFCDQKDNVHGYLTVPLNRLCSDSGFLPIESEFRLLPYDETKTIIEPYPNVGIVIELNQENLNESLSKYELKRSQAKPMNRSFHQLPLHHYCYTLDIRSISINDLKYLPILSTFIQYSYAFFGFIDKLKTSKVDLLDMKDVVFEEGFCAFNFATTQSQLKQTFDNVPLILELVQSDAGHNSLIATSSVKLGLIFSFEDNNEKQVRNTNVSFLNCDKEVIGELQLVMCLQDLGDAKIGHSVAAPENVNGNGKQDSDDVVDRLLCEAASEIEMWKNEQFRKFKDEIRQKEEECLSRMSEKENGRNDELTKKIEKMDELEVKLRESLAKLEMKEKKIESKEEEISKKQVELKKRFSRLDGEITDAIKDIQSKYEEKLKAAKDEIKLLKEQKEEMELKMKLDKGKEIKKTGTIEGKKVITSSGSVSNSKPVATSSIQLNGHKTITKAAVPDIRSQKLRTRSVDSHGKSILTQPVKRTVSIKSQVNGKTKPNSAPNTTSKFISMLEQLEKDKEDLLANGVPPTDSIIKEINLQLSKHKQMLNKTSK